MKKKTTHSAATHWRNSGSFATSFGVQCASDWLFPHRCFSRATPIPHGLRICVNSLIKCRPSTGALQHATSVSISGVFLPL